MILIFGSVPDALTSTLPTVISLSISLINNFKSLSLIISLLETVIALLICGILVKFESTSDGFLPKISKDDITFSSAIFQYTVLTRSLHMMWPDVSPPSNQPFFDSVSLTYLSPTSALTNL